MLIAWTVIIGFCSLAVDFGHVSLVKSQLQCVADAAAHAAVFSFYGGVTAAKNAAVAIGAASSVDGSAVTINSSTDIAFGTWSSSTQTFTALPAAQQSLATAIQVTTHRTAAGGNAVKLTFAGLFGQTTCDVHATSIASIAPGIGLVNYSFESPALSAGNYVYQEPMPGWTLNVGACLATYGSAWGMSSAPSGNQAIALQGGYGYLATISQTFTATAGVYSVSFLGAQRTSYYSGSGPQQPISVTMDGTQIALITPVDGTFRTYNTPTVTLTAGSHTLMLSATDQTGDKTSFVDNVAINQGVSNVVLSQ
jgi:Flp pilus assembly protein TadG